jgi:hypothetical protein
MVGPTRIFSIPRHKWSESLKMLGIQFPEKNPKRVAHGIQLGRQSQIKGNVGHNRKKLKGIVDEIFLEEGLR